MLEYGSGKFSLAVERSPIHSGDQTMNEWKRGAYIQGGADWEKGIRCIWTQNSGDWDQ